MLSMNPSTDFRSCFSFSKGSSCMQRSWESKLTEVSQKLGDYKDTVFPVEGRSTWVWIVITWSWWGRYRFQTYFEWSSQKKTRTFNGRPTGHSNSFRISQALRKLVNFLNKGKSVNKQIKPLTHGSILRQPIESFRFRFSFTN